MRLLRTPQEAQEAQPRPIFGQRRRKHWAAGTGVIMGGFSHSLGPGLIWAVARVSFTRAERAKLLASRRAAAHPPAPVGARVAR